MGWSATFSVSPNLRSGVNITTLVESLRMRGRGDLADAFSQIGVAIANVERVLRETISISSDTVDVTGPNGQVQTSVAPGDIVLYDANGVEIFRAANSSVSINGLKVLGARGAAVADVAGTATMIYTATEQAMINDLKAAVNAILARMRASTGHGLIS